MSQGAPAPAPPGHSDERSRRAGTATPKRRLIADRLARFVVSVGGMAIIASILGILVFILVEIAPLFGGGTVEVAGKFDLHGPPVQAVLTDEYRTQFAALSDDGVLRIVRAADGELLARHTILAGENDPDPEQVVAVAAPPGRQLLALSTDRGRILAVPVEWAIDFVGAERRVVAKPGEAVVFDTGGEAGPLNPFAVQLSADGPATAVGQAENGRLLVLRREVEENLFTGEYEESFARYETAPVQPLTAIVVDLDGREVFAGTSSGELIWWRLSDGEPGEARVLPAQGGGVTALSLLLGDRSLLVGREDGEISVWFVVRREEGRQLESIRSFPALDGSVSLIAPSMRNKGFMAQTDRGRIGLFHSTSERLLWQGDSPVPGASALFFSPKSDGAVLAGDGVIASLDVDNPHPEVSLKSLFGKVWYEGYPEPEHVWQSTGGTDDFEPKLSLTPLMVGTFKGTVYSLLLAVPLGVLGAMYTSQFMHPSFKRYVKPTVEIMAALPSVVLGFLAGLWLAPRLDRYVPAMAVFFLLAPPLMLVGAFLWKTVPRRIRAALPDGIETVVYAILLLIGGWLALGLGGSVERLVFDGDFQAWLLGASGLRYDQRNALVVGIAMGFAVIPIIFSISEEAFTNVPRNLVSGSLALGANRWQTVTRVVLPTASAGIFTAVMIGFGRAIGETMIVLMATGNTPIMDWNPFNGFRTLSANIAVEIPEAPQGGTLYRTLFLAALILFTFTFAINTVAEMVRQRLRRRYAKL